MATAILVTTDGRETHLDRAELIQPLEVALHSFAWGLTLLAAALVVARS
jgi:hypothetical protein